LDAGTAVRISRRGDEFGAIPEAIMDDSFKQLAMVPGGGIVSEFWYFVRHNKKWWLLPILLVLLFFGVLVLLSSSAAAPFIYTLF
jgi:hypothetical protein